MDTIQQYEFERGPIRPPSEGRDYSLLVRATRNCPWNQCRFCSSYKGQRFVYRQPDEVKADIAVIRRIADGLSAESWRDGAGGEIRDDVLASFMQHSQQLYGRDSLPADTLHGRIQCLMLVANWMASGGRTVFLQDADTLIMRTHDLVDVISYLKATFPGIQRITCYARSKTLFRKAAEELRTIREAGLSRVHIGLESGCDDVLTSVRKGVTAGQQVEAGLKARAAGLEVSEYVIPGLGGRSLSRRHAMDTAGVLNRISPDFIRLRSLVARLNTPLRDQVKSGGFDLMNDEETVYEIRLLIEQLDCRSYLASDQMSNLLWEIEGRLPEDKARMLRVITEFQSLEPLERLTFVLRRRWRSYLGVFGSLTEELDDRVKSAMSAIQAKSPDAHKEVEKAVSALKDGFV